MTVTAKIVRKMVDMGLNAAQIADLCDVIEEGFSAPVEMVPGALLKRRAYDRSRKREKRNSGGIPPDRADAEPTPNSTGIPPEFHRTEPPLARVEDNLPRLVDTCSGGGGFARERFSDWNRERLDALAGRLREAAGLALNVAAPTLLDLSPIIGLLNGGDGPPCDLEMDILPTIRATAPSAQPGSLNRWKWFKPAIVRSRDERLAGAPAASVIVDFPRGQGPPRGYAAHEAEQAAMRADVRKRLLESP